MCANFRVSRFDSLSDGWVGTISRSFVKASFKLCVLCLSRTLAEKHNKYKNCCIIFLDFTLISLRVELVLWQRLAAAYLWSGLARACTAWPGVGRAPAAAGVAPLPRGWALGPGAASQAEAVRRGEAGVQRLRAVWWAQLREAEGGELYCPGQPWLWGLWLWLEIVECGEQRPEMIVIRVQIIMRLGGVRGRGQLVVLGEAPEQGAAGRLAWAAVKWAVWAGQRVLLEFFFDWNVCGPKSVQHGEGLLCLWGVLWKVAIRFWAEIFSRVSVIHDMNVSGFCAIRSEPGLNVYTGTWVWLTRRQGRGERWRGLQRADRFVCDVFCWEICFTDECLVMVMLMTLLLWWSQNSLTEVRRPQGPALVWAQLLLSLSPDTGARLRLWPARAGAGSGPGPAPAWSPGGAGRHRQPRGAGTGLGRSREI